jgi:hypothetical protein
MRWNLLAIPVAAMATAPAAGSIAQPDRDEEIVIVGETMREAQRQAQAYVQQVGIAVGNQPTARWVDPICPNAVGLAPDKEAIVKQQVRELVRQVGAPLAKENCAPNFMIVFTDGPEAVVETMTRKGNNVLREVAPTVAQAIKQGAAPIRWFYQTDVRTREGLSSSDVVNPALLNAVPDQPEGPAIRYGEGGLLNVKGSSHISSQAVRTIKHATVIIDVVRAKGHSLRAVTDYAALVGLAEIKFGASPPRSILSLFDPQAPVTELSKRDVAMLTGLYRIHLDRRAEQQRRTLVNRILKTDLDAEARRVQQ